MIEVFTTMIEVEQHSRRSPGLDSLITNAPMVCKRSRFRDARYGSVKIAHECIRRFSDVLMTRIYGVNRDIECDDGVQ